jgi:hypothetical protein
MFIKEIIKNAAASTRNLFHLIILINIILLSILHKVILLQALALIRHPNGPGVFTFASPHS